MKRLILILLSFATILLALFPQMVVDKFKMT